MNLFLLVVQDKLYQEEYLFVVSEEEKEQISGKLREASEWMDEEGYSATTKQLREKLSQLKSLCRDMFFRVEERRKWPDRLAALESMLNTSTFFLRWAAAVTGGAPPSLFTAQYSPELDFCFCRSAKMIPEDDQIFTDVELNLLEKVINETTVGNVSDVWYDAYPLLLQATVVEHPGQDWEALDVCQSPDNDSFCLTYPNMFQL